MPREQLLDAATIDSCPEAEQFFFAMMCFSDYFSSSDQRAQALDKVGAELSRRNIVRFLEENKLTDSHEIKEVKLASMSAESRLHFEHNLPSWTCHDKCTYGATLPGWLADTNTV